MRFRYLSFALPVEMKSERGLWKQRPGSQTTANEEQFPHGIKYGYILDVTLRMGKHFSLLREKAWQRTLLVLYW
ncbi:putative chaperone ClpB [Ktedonobacter racemifer DSM 44963]|uniref:Putative chaperone ClpB n=1 Tax=Ktedonobacter racemifer DSM 44963 TaxID=485913 RepID=D6TK83_KTERA|nr:putative chaperone ClpB [Ktedonobacter racemifer DSM 44963]